MPIFPDTLMISTIVPEVILHPLSDCTSKERTCPSISAVISPVPCWGIPTRKDVFRPINLSLEKSDEDCCDKKNFIICQAHNPINEPENNPIIPSIKNFKLTNFIIESTNYVIQSHPFQNPQENMI